MNQTDPRTVAKRIVDDSFIGVAALHTLSSYDAEVVRAFLSRYIAQALANAERRGMERAAKVVDEMYLKPERIWDADTLDGAINNIRAKAKEAGQ